MAPSGSAWSSGTATVAHSAAAAADQSTGATGAGRSVGSSAGLSPWRRSRGRRSWSVGGGRAAVGVAARAGAERRARDGQDGRQSRASRRTCGVRSRPDLRSWRSASSVDVVELGLDAGRWRRPASSTASLEVVGGDDVGQGEADRRQLPGEVLGVGLGAGVDLAVELGLGPVALVLAVLGQQDQRGGVGGLGGERQVQQDERVRVPAQPDGDDVEGDPDDDEHGLADQEAAGAEEAGDALGEAAERVGVEVDAETPPRAGRVRSSERRNRTAMGQLPAARRRRRRAPGVGARSDGAASLGQHVVEHVVDGDGADSRRAESHTGTTTRS